MEQHATRCSGRPGVHASTSRKRRGGSGRCALGEKKGGGAVGRSETRGELAADTRGALAQLGLVKILSSRRSVPVYAGRGVVDERSAMAREHLLVSTAGRLYRVPRPVADRGRDGPPMRDARRSWRSCAPSGDGGAERSQRSKDVRGWRTGAPRAEGAAVRRADPGRRSAARSHPRGRRWWRCGRRTARRHSWWRSTLRPAAVAGGVCPGKAALSGWWRQPDLAQGGGGPRPRRRHAPHVEKAITEADTTIASAGAALVRWLVCPRVPSVVRCVVYGSAWTSVRWGGITRSDVRHPPRTGPMARDLTAAPERCPTTLPSGGAVPEHEAVEVSWPSGQPRRQDGPAAIGVKAYWTDGRRDRPGR